MAYSRLIYFSFILLVSCYLFQGCATFRSNTKPPDTVFLQQLFDRYHGNFAAVFDSPDHFNLQVIYTRIDRRRNNQPVFTDFHFNISPSNYFYPASTVKLPVALLALQKLNELTLSSLPPETAMITEADHSWESPVYNDPMAMNGNPTIASYIKKIFLVSDNDAFNRLYEFCGQEYINNSLAYMGYDSSEIIHRLSVPLIVEQNRYNNPIRFVNDSGKVIFQVPAGRSNWIRYKRNETMGEGYLAKGKLIHEPFDFASKNRFLLTDLHNVLKSTIFPESVQEQKRFRIRNEDRRLILNHMSAYPSESRFPFYDSLEYWDTYGKFLLYGAEKEPVKPGIRIFNKVGSAYGFLTDVAYIVDFENNIEFMLSASIYCNSDGIFNDDSYDYDTIGLPVLKHIGQVLYNYELTRNKKRKPDLSAFRFNYLESPNAY
jgi:hypothetical protein